MQPQCDGEDCCGNGIGDYSCYPIGWINACSIGYYVSDRCTTNFLFRIKKDGVVIEGPLVAKSFAFTPPFGEVADYTIEYCVGVSEPCSWITLVAATEVDTTSEDACPMGIYGQTYVIGTRPSDNEQMPMGVYLYCQSVLVVRVSALADFGQLITHLWIDDILFTPMANYAGGLATIGGGDLLPYSFVCHTGRDYGHADIPWDNTTLTQIRVPLPIPFTKGSFSVRARQTNGMMIGCTVGVTCTSHYNAASTTLPSWSGMSLACEADGAMPFGFMSDPTGIPPKTWCQHFETSLDIVPTGDTGGTFSWRTCQASTTNSMVVGTFACTYNFKCNGQIRWIDPSDSIPRPVYSGTYSFDHTVTWDMNLVLGALYRPGDLQIGNINAHITGDVTSTISGHNDWPTALQAAGLFPDMFTLLNAVWNPASYTGPVWFLYDLFNRLECDTPYDGDTFQWKWIGPRFPVAYWTIETPDVPGFPVVPSPFFGGGGGGLYTNANWPADTSFYCELPEGSYYDVTESAVAAQFQV